MFKRDLSLVDNIHDTSESEYKSDDTGEHDVNLISVFGINPVNTGESDGNPVNTGEFDGNPDDTGEFDGNPDDTSKSEVNPFVPNKMCRNKPICCNGHLKMRHKSTSYNVRNRTGCRGFGKYQHPLRYIAFRKQNVRKNLSDSAYFNLLLELEIARQCAEQTLMTVKDEPTRQYAEDTLNAIVSSIDVANNGTCKN